MTNTEFKTWDDYVKEAQIEPFKLPISKDETLEISAPSGVQVIQFESAARKGDAEAMLWAITGEQWERLRELLATGGHKAMNDLLTDMMLHFDIAHEVQLVSPDGGKRSERDPRKIKNLLKSGYRTAGEAGART